MNDQLRIDEIFSSIQGEGFLAGRRQVFIRFCGCNLSCSYCDTDLEKSERCRIETRPGSASFISIPQPVSPGMLTKIVSEWLAALPGAHHSISLTGGEPLLQAEILHYCLPGLKRLLPIHLETNGVLSAELENVVENLDYISMDIKLPSSAGCSEHLWEQHRQFLQIADAGPSQVSVKIIVAENTSSVEINQVCGIISAANPSIPLFIQPLSLAGGGIGISSSKLLHLQETASSFIRDVRVIPQMHKFLKLL
jgi:7-carboxy-7-deazaguanine synthase